MFDRKTTGVGIIFFTGPTILLLILYLQPFDIDTMGMISLFVSIVAFIVSFSFTILLLKLYGTKSSEGRFWVYILIMLALTLVGSIVPLIYEPLKFSYFAAAAFLVVAYGIIEKLKLAGMKPKIADLAIATTIIMGIMAFISVVMIQRSGTAPIEFNAADYAIEFTVVICALVATFASVLLARLMGGHISKGWYFIAFAGGLFAMSFTFISIYKVLGLYHDGHFLDAFNIMALNAVTFSAYFQRKMHLELISGLDLD